MTFAALPRPIDHVLRIKTGTGTFIMWFKIPGPCSGVQVYVLYSTVRCGGGGAVGLYNSSATAAAWAQSAVDRCRGHTLSAERVSSRLLL